MKKLLAIISDPANCDTFIQYTCHMSEDMSRMPYFLYILNPAVYTMSSGSVRPGTEAIGFDIETDKKNALKLIQENINKVKKKVPGNLPFNFSAELGPADMVIKRMLAENGADMYIVEGRQKSGIWGLDNVNIELTQKVDCPGWIIPYKFHYRPFRNIIYATDFKKADIDTLKSLIKLTGAYSPYITAVHLTGSDDFEKEVKKTGFENMIKEKMGYKNSRVVPLVERGKKSPGEYIDEFAVKNDADLIVLLKENKNFTERLFGSSFSKNVIRKTEFPVLVFHE